MPLDPRSLQTIVNSTIYKNDPVDIMGDMSASIENVKNSIEAKANNLIDRSKDAISDVISSVGKVVDKYAPSMIAGMAGVQFRGTQGSFQSYTVPIRLDYRYYRITENRSDEIGNPVHRYYTLSDLTGFVLCENARVPLVAFQSEQAAIEEFLNSGIYIE